MSETELIVRAIIVKDGKILLCKNIKGGGYYFLPGGHIENGESPEVALERELVEEIDRKTNKTKRIAEIKNTYNENNETIVETFYICLTALSDYENIKSKEDHLEFDWVPIDDLEEVDFKPKHVIKEILKNIEANKDF